MKPSILQKFTTNLRESLKSSLKLALELGQPEITPLHLLYGLTAQKGSVASEILEKTATAKDKILSFLADLPRDEVKITPVLSDEATKTLERAAILAASSAHRYIGTEHLLSALLKSQDTDLEVFFNQDAKTKEHIKKHLSDVIKSVNQFPEMVSMMGNNQCQDDGGLGQMAAVAMPAGKSKKNSALDFFTYDLTAQAATRKMDPVIGRARETQRIIQILCRRHKNNPVLLGEPGVGKTAIVEGLAQRITAGDVPDDLQGKKILQLDLGLLIAGTIYRGEFEARLKQLLEEVTKDENIILFIDEIHIIVGAGSAPGTLDAANILKPALARGQIHCIGATTYEEYKKSIETDAALERRLEPVIVNEPSTEETVMILAGLVKNYEKYHHLKISHDAIVAAVSLAGRYLPQKFFPDKAIDLLDEAASAKKLIAKASKDLRLLKSKERELGLLEDKKRDAVLSEEFEKAIKLKDDETKLLEEVAELKNKLDKKNYRAALGEVGQADVAKIVSQINGLPFESVLNSLLTVNLSLKGGEKERLLSLEAELEKHIVGQSEAIGTVAQTLRRARLGLSSPRRPLASFIFVGPTGVGKTELAKVLAELLFPAGRGMEGENFIRIVMSELSESFHATKLVGAPAGYIGYKEGNKLADKIKHHPYSVVLFDEIDKAHPDIFNLFLQILDEGHLTDAAGKKINFKNTVIILTTNLGEEIFNKKSFGFGEVGVSGAEADKVSVETKKNVMNELKVRFRAEFLNRLDQVLIFKPLNLFDLEKIIGFKMEELNARLNGKGVELSVGGPARQFLAQEAKKLDQGARAIDKVIRDFVEEPLVKLLLERVGEDEKQKIEISIIKNQIRFTPTPSSRRISGAGTE